MGSSLRASYGSAGLRASEACLPPKALAVSVALLPACFGAFSTDQNNTLALTKTGIQSPKKRACEKGAPRAR